MKSSQRQAEYTHFFNTISSMKENYKMLRMENYFSKIQFFPPPPNYEKLALQITM